MPPQRYKLIATDIMKRIDAGEFSAGKLPSMDKLRFEYNTSWRTLSKVWEMLRAERVIRVVPGVGTFLVTAFYIPKQRKHR